MTITITATDRADLVRQLLPRFQHDEDNEGQLVLYTDHQLAEPTDPSDPQVVPMDPSEYAFWTSEGWIDRSVFEGCVTVSSDVGTGRHTNSLCDWLEASGLDGEAQWVVLRDGSLVATQSIDHPLYDGQPGWELETKDHD